MITEGYLGMHYGGRRGGRDAALLDVAQDYAIKIISDKGLFGLGLTFKGGTALRKYRVGPKGRFSTDLDFAADDESIGELLIETLDGAELNDVQFRIEDAEGGRRGSLQVTTPLGSPNIESKIEMVLNSPWLSAEYLDPIPMPFHGGLEFEPVMAPVMALEENLAEKLAAFRRRGLVRDLYDLALFSEGALDEPLIRKLTFLKVYTDVVEGGLGDSSFDPDPEILGPKSSADFPAENIGVLTGAVDIDLWIWQVRHRFAFLGEASEDELRWARCSQRDAYEVRGVIEDLRKC